MAFVWAAGSRSAASLRPVDRTLRSRSGRTPGSWSGTRNHRGFAGRSGVVRRWAESAPPGNTIKATVLRISLLRLLVSLGAGLLAAHWLAGLSWSVAAVYSAIVLATGPTVVTPLIRQIRLAAPLGDVLEAEGLVLEPIGAVLALLLLELVLGDLHGWRELVLGLLSRLGGGVLIGASVGWLLSELLRRLNPDQATGLPLQLSLGMLFLMYGVSEWLLPESGLPASVAAGVVVARRPCSPG